MSSSWWGGTRSWTSCAADAPRLVVGRESVSQGEAAKLLVRLVGSPTALGHQEGGHPRRVYDQQGVAALVAIEHDPVIAVEAERPVGLQLDQLGEEHLLAEVPVEEGDVHGRDHLPNRHGHVAWQAREVVDDP